MTKTGLTTRYRHYIGCLNARDWSNLARFVDDAVTYNGERVGLAGYREMLEGDFRAIPDLRFNPQIVIAEPPRRVAARLLFDCTPQELLFGFAVNGRGISFSENVFYGYHHEKIHEVWSVIDKPAVGAQLGELDQNS